MEQVLDIYARLYDPACPVVCMDEQPVQLVKETRSPMPATQELAGWTERGVDWQVKVDDARCKLKSAYPTVLV